MRSVVVCHGDCDGVISSFLYIKHYMRDAYPGNVELILTQPWRAHVDLKRVARPFAEFVMLDIALSKEVADYIMGLVGPNTRITVIDHHASSEAFVGRLVAAGVKVVWSRAVSTPRLIVETLRPSINPYEEFLVGVADICEGAEVHDEEAMRVADLIKLSIARDPGDTNFMHYLIRSMLSGFRIQSLDEVVKRASLAKWLLNRLIDRLVSRSVTIGSYLVTTLTASESRVYAGILGIASTELSRKAGSDVVLVREEEGKVVVTVRSGRREALTLCRLIVEMLGGRYGGHPEAASATLSNRSLDEVQRAILEVVGSVDRAASTR